MFVCEVEFVVYRIGIKIFYLEGKRVLHITLNCSMLAMKLG